jgi:hypothetical protein
LLFHRGVPLVIWLMMIWPASDRDWQCPAAEAKELRHASRRATIGKVVNHPTVALMVSNAAWSLGRTLGVAPANGLISPVTMSLFDQGISGAMMTSIAVSPSMAKMTATARVESD